MEKTGSRATSHKKLKTAPITTTEQAPVKRSYPTASFQIRTALGIKELAERLADEQAIARSKLDAQIYRRGLLLTLLLCGPGADGFYAGKTEQELAQLLVPLFDRLYAVLDSHHLLANYVCHLSDKIYRFSDKMPRSQAPLEDELSRITWRCIFFLFSSHRSAHLFSLLFVTGAKIYG